MKTTLRMALILTVMAAVMSLSLVTAGAARYEAQADALFELGLFTGSDGEYELDRAPTRGEAAVMLVRLLGREAEVKAENYEHPFTDVPEWVSSYIGYLYQNKLTNGITDTTYEPSTPCSAQMYTAFVLRALGFSDKEGDFDYAKTQEFAVSKGILAEPYPSDYTFLRDDTVAVSYSALFASMNTEAGKTLLESLITAGAVDEELGGDYLEQYSLYQEISKISEAFNNSSAHYRIGYDIGMHFQQMGISATITQEMDVKSAVKDGKTTFMMDITTSMFGSNVRQSYYYADGWAYVKLDETRVKFKSDYEALSQAAQMSGTGDFSFMESITKKQDGTGTVYTMRYSAEALNQLMGSALSAAGTENNSSVFCEYITLELYLNAAGEITRQNIQTKLSVTAVQGGEEVTSDMEMSIELEVLATGSGVTITPPADLDTYEELSEEEGEAFLPMSA